MKEYNHKAIEKKWQTVWEKKQVFRAKDKSKQKKFYSLIEFPYPSGDGLHVGHIRSNTAMDIISRKRRMEGFNVMYPTGWDAFGLPTENYAIKTGIQPIVVTKKNTDTFRRQLKALGFSFDWSREVNTTDPKYYKWTQWIFLQLLKHDLAYKAKINVNWCPKDKTGLANEEVIDGCCERCGTPVEKREKEQWLLRITKYAERLDKDLDGLDFQEKIKLQQKNWIGKSEGAEIDFDVSKNPQKIKVFTTRPDTIFGATYIVLAPEHSLVKELWSQIENKQEIENYVALVKKKTEIDRTSVGKEKTGVELRGIFAINPATKEKIPIWIADYVLANYGTGAIMAVPAHDERDGEFAKKFGLQIKKVIAPYLIDQKDPPIVGKKTISKIVVQCVVENPTRDKILVLKWQKFPWVSFISGGVEGDEDFKKTALREIKEETGYVDVKSIELIGSPFFTTYHASHKNENREAEVHVFKIVLNSEKKIETAKFENEKFNAVWVDHGEARKTVNQVEASEIWKMLSTEENFYTEDGKLINSEKFTGMSSERAKKEITHFVGGKTVTKYKLRDWVFSRQRYWGEPIPVVHCSKCGIVPLPEKSLPLVLPKIKNFQPTESGESPLATLDKWVNTKCPKCGGTARRETDTIPNWAGSSWYFLRFADPKNSKTFADSKKLKAWMQVDWYNGGMEHTTLHLLYSRFWNKFLFDLKLVPTSEPYKKRTSHGLILAQGGVKMSKSIGNVINPDDLVKNYGADTLRMYEMFMGPFGEAIAWADDNIFGVRRFVERVWKLWEKYEVRSKKYEVRKANSKFVIRDSNFDLLLHKTIKKVSDDIENMAFNTAVSAMMILLNEMERQESISKNDFEMFLQILNPFAPHITEEIWNNLGHKTLLVNEKWPKADPKKMKEVKVKIAVQINGKVRAECVIDVDAKEEEVTALAKSEPDVEKWLLNKEIKKVIYIKNRLLNFVVL